VVDCPPCAAMQTPCIQLKCNYRRAHVMFQTSWVCKEQHISNSKLCPEALMCYIKLKKIIWVFCTLEWIRIG
jgi:hypothetical protein